MGSRLLPTVDGVAAKALKDLDVDDGIVVEEKQPKNKSGRGNIHCCAMAKLVDNRVIGRR